MEEADGAAVAAAFRKGVDAAYSGYEAYGGHHSDRGSAAAEVAEQIAASNNDAWIVLRSHGCRRGSPGKDAETAAGAEKAPAW